MHVHWLDCRNAGDTADLLSLLSPEEYRRYEKFVFARDKALFTQAHALKRLTLASYTGTGPKELSFDQNAQGKPFLRPRRGSAAPGFNLSHTHGMVVLAVAYESDIGVDVENVQRTGRWDDLVQTVFTVEEQAGIWACPPDERPRKFYELWTFKEAYVKARGLGLSLPLQEFTIRSHAGGYAVVSTVQDTRNGATDWQLESFSIEPFHIAIAIRASQKWKIQWHPASNSSRTNTSNR